MIKVDYINKFPEWWKERNYYDLILSNDIDSLFSCEILKQVKGWDIQYFYDFSNVYVTDEADISKRPIGVDIAVNIKNFKCFDNHVVMLSTDDYCNEQSINFNVADKVSRSNYFQKYCGSTLLLVWALYDIPLPKSEEGKMILLAIDSTYKGFYSTFQNDKISNKHYLVEVMGFPELYEVLKRHTQQDFNKIIYKYNLHKNIEIWDKKLNTDIDLEGLRKEFDLPFFMPKTDFLICKELTNKAVSLPKCNLNISKQDISENIFSCALTRKDFFNYSQRLLNM
ncbi:hypothetical protein [Clostridium sp. BNL1100]|uniref:hypothetical protein n=1 Tax=Clostridium sp. BNL1100 TaxID=755731 RepID=UPI00024A7764|nr:hypothetical protein [Clostridium sp. BNL1100]AEY67843.1 hypothetical protein Clo1100_3724 [Clostridium sp. BNL1100]